MTDENNNSTEANANSDEAKESVVGSDYVPRNSFVNSFLTDLYQITMAYAYWTNKQTKSRAVFDLYFRKCPFKGEYCIFAGLDDVLRFLNSFCYTKEQIAALQNRFSTWNPKFFEYLLTLDASEIRVLAQREGSVVFPSVPLIRVEGPIVICQLIETTLLNLVNYASLITTNAARIRVAVGAEKKLLEFGLRRAQGPDGAMSASRYAFLGGFDGTSNVAAGLMHDIPVLGTHAHSFVSSYPSLAALDRANCEVALASDATQTANLYDSVLKYRQQLAKGPHTNDGELAAFIAYGNAFPAGFLALVDTYSTLESGIVNFAAVALALYKDFGYTAKGIRLDSGDLAYLSKESRTYFVAIAEQFEFPALATTMIVASNDINESVLYALKDQGHEIDSFGIGTHLVTCKRQPALGCVYKLVEVDGVPRIKLSQSRGKTTIPGKKLAYRLFIGSATTPILDVLVLESDQTRDTPYVSANANIVCEAPFHNEYCKVETTKAVPLLNEVWNCGKVLQAPIAAKDMRQFCIESVQSLREDYVRISNPTPYKVSVSTSLKALITRLIREEAPVTTYK